MSAAAQPADPERALAPDREAALARLESLLSRVLRAGDDRNLWKQYDDELHAAASWLLPLARAGLRAQSPVAADEKLARMWFGDPCDATCSLNDAVGSDGPPCECQQRLIADFAAVRGAGDALRSVLTDAVALLNRSLGSPAWLKETSEVAERAAAVLRSPEPAKETP